MKYDFFVRYAKENDERNSFGIADVEILNLPDELKGFYSEVDPLDVYITFTDFTSLRFYPLHSLSELQQEFSANAESFVFATYEGDPIWLSDSGVGLGIHGIGEEQSAILEKDLYSFIVGICDNERESLL